MLLHARGFVIIAQGLQRSSRSWITWNCSKKDHVSDSQIHSSLTQVPSRALVAFSTALQAVGAKRGLVTEAVFVSFQSNDWLALTPLLASTPCYQVLL